ncbi:MAG: hypothetical protein NXH74_05965 [Rhodobacteraceae bacterium]|nr:hypothetical protein [Paracoccaceae bacterium]
MALSKERRAELDKLLAQSAASGFMSDIEKLAAEERSGLAALKEAALGLATVTNARQTLFNEGQTRLLKWLRKGTVVAVAYESPRKLSDLPAVVPAEVICTARSLDWEAGMLKRAGLHLVELRFIPSQRADEIRAASTSGVGQHSTKLSQPDPAETARPVGRPAIGPFIEEAFHALLEVGKIDLSASMASHYPLVRKWLEREHPETITQRGMPGNEAIRKTFAPLFKRAKMSAPKL